MADLTLADILDLRAYERVRDDFRRQVMAQEAAPPVPRRAR